VGSATSLGELDLFIAWVVRVVVMEVMIGEVRVVLQMFVMQAAARARVRVDAVDVVLAFLS